MKKLKLVDIINLSYHDSITKDKVYDCLNDIGEYYEFKNDQNIVIRYYKWRFKDVSRELKIKKLL